MSPRELLCTPSQVILAILDTALLPDYAQVMASENPAAFCLLGNTQEAGVLMKSPWVAAFRPASAFGSWLSSRMSEVPCGLATVTPGPEAAALERVAALQQLTTIQDEDGTPLLLRWWDVRARSLLELAGGVEIFADIDALLPGALYAEPPLPLTFRNA